LRACEIAGAEPQFQTWEFAMGIALLYPKEKAKGGRGVKGSNSKRAAETAGVSERRIQQARQVLDYSRELALRVRDGAEPLDLALARVQAEFLAEKAGAIRALAKNVVRDVIEIGRHLSETKLRVGHGKYLQWIEREFEWSHDTEFYANA
jgi:hypothetical protein